MQRASTPPILRRGSKSRRRRESNDFADFTTSSVQSAEDRQHTIDIDFLLDGGAKTTTTLSPMRGLGSPIKQLPFSPSQFLNSPHLPFDSALSSTPVKRLQVSTPKKSTRVSRSENFGDFAITPVYLIFRTEIIVPWALLVVSHVNRKWNRRQLKSWLPIRDLERATLPGRRRRSRRRWRTSPKSPGLLLNYLTLPQDSRTSLRSWRRNRTVPIMRLIPAWWFK